MVCEVKRYDVVIAGAGTIGLFIAYELAKRGVKVAVIEKEKEAGFGVSKGHAAVIHVIQLPLGSLKSRLAIYGNKMYDRVSKELGVRLRRVPALLVAQSAPQLLLLPLLFAFVKLYYGLKGFRVSYVGPRRLRELEPNVAGRAAVMIDGYGIIDSFGLTYALQRACEVMGAEMIFETAVERVEPTEGGVRVHTSRGVIESSFFVNSAGLHSDELARIAGLNERIEAKRGTMIVFDRPQTKSIVAPLSLNIRGETKGGGIIPTIDGKTIWGPGLVREGSKEDRGVGPHEVLSIIRRFSPLVRVKGIPIKIYAGNRPSRAGGDFLISYSPLTRRIVNLVGIESPGLTAAPAIAAIVLDMLRREGLKLGVAKVAQRTRGAKGGAKGRGRVICLCTGATIGDLEEAIKAGARTLDGISFRTGIGMGRCQGQHCMARTLVEASRLLGVPPGEIAKSVKGSWIAR